MSIRVFYHANCPDGLASAAVACRKFGNNANYVALNYGDPFVIEKGDGVYFVDFSVKRDVMLELSKDADYIVVIDHHKTAEAELVDLPSNVELVFDMSKCGAVLTHEYFFPNEPVPELIYYVQDRDLWKWELPYSKEVNEALYVLPRDISNHSQALYKLKSEPLVAQGIAILAAKEMTIQSILRNSYQMLINNTICPAVNSCSYMSEVGNELAKESSNGFSCVWFLLPDGRYKYSLRGNGSFDCSELAASFGGGGHHNAAGFTLDYLLPRP